MCGKKCTQRVVQLSAHAVIIVIIVVCRHVSNHSIHFYVPAGRRKGDIPWSLDPGISTEQPMTAISARETGTESNQKRRLGTCHSQAQNLAFQLNNRYASLTVPAQHASLHRIKYSSPDRRCSFATVSRSISTKGSGRCQQVVIWEACSSASYGP